MMHQPVVWKLSHYLFKKIYPAEAKSEYLSRSVLASDKSRNVYKAFRFTADNWDKLLSIIRHNHLQIIVLRSRVGIDSLPGDVQKTLISDALLVQLRAKRQEREFTRVIQLLARNDIKFVVMKAPHIVKRLHSEPVKVDLDLDLLMPVSQYQAMSAILKRDGYHHKNFPGPNHIRGDFYVPRGEEIFVKNGMTVELHTTIVNTSGFATRILDENTNRLLTEEFYRDSVAVKFNGTYVNILKPSSLFTSLFVHSLYQHNYQSVMRYYQAARLLITSRKDMQWRRITAFTKKYRLYRYFLWYICFLDDLFPGVVPKDILMRARSYQRSWGIIRILLYFFLKYRLFHPEVEFSDTQKRVTWFLMEERLFPSFMKKITVPLTASARRIIQ